LAYAAEPSFSEEETVSQLLSLAQGQVANLALTTPEGDNAYETYRLILSLQPNNESALAGIGQIGVEYASLAEQAAARSRIEQARRYADKAVALAPNHPDVLAMEAALRAREQAAAEAAPPVLSVAAASTLSMTSETSSGVQAKSADIEVAALADLSAAAGGSETLATKRSQAPKPELLTSGLLYAVSALDAHQVGNYDEAIQFYTLAIEAGDLPDRSLAYVYNNRGASYRNMNRYNQAIEDYDAAIRLNPEYATAYYNRGIAYDRKGFHGLAIDDFDTAIRLNPDLSDAYNQRGLAYVKDGRYDIAIENFSQAIRLDPELDSAYFNRGLVYHSTGDSDRAAEDIRRSHALDPDNPEYGKKMRELGIL
jgi:tetratricopeptide (TPR) repeat protein